MKPVKIFILLIFIFVVSILLLSSCAQEGSFRKDVATSAKSSESSAINDPAVKPQQVSLNQADQSQSMAEAMDRKILKDATLSLEVAAPAEAQREITSMAESLGGFVVTSESKVLQVGDAKQELEINLVIRVPATQFDTALKKLHSMGSGVIPEKLTGQDVTEEFIDLEARIKTQKALESQFLEIMKQAKKVSDALDVQRQIAEVRTEIEKLEGRKRFLENRASLSTITVTLHAPTAIAVSASGFGRTIREAVGESVDVASGIVLFLIRFVIVMVPIFILIILPGWLLTRFFLHRARKMQFARQPVPATISDSQPD